MKKRMIALLGALLLALPAHMEGGGALERFQERAQLNMDEAMEQRVSAFLRDFDMDEARIARLPEALLTAYARNLSAAWPLEYGALLEEAAQPFSRLTTNEAPQVLILLKPGDPGAECFIADFECGACYYDSLCDVSGDVCRAERFPEWSAALEAALTEALQKADYAGWAGEYQGDSEGLRPQKLTLALRTEKGLYRLTAMGRSNGLPESAQALIEALFEIARST